MGQEEDVMTETAAVSWAAAELGRANLGDARLNRRLVRVAERLGAQPGARIPVACRGGRRRRRRIGCWRTRTLIGRAVLTPHWECGVERMRCQPVVLYWLLTSIPNQPVRDVWNRQRLNRANREWEIVVVQTPYWGKAARGWPARRPAMAHSR
jgi:hypothetical protein